eukprot:5277769-Pyramimonas_sp.AAC.1
MRGHRRRYHVRDRCTTHHPRPPPCDRSLLGYSDPSRQHRTYYLQRVERGQVLLRGLLVSLDAPDLLGVSVDLLDLLHHLLDRRHRAVDVLDEL